MCDNTLTFSLFLGDSNFYLPIIVGSVKYTTGEPELFTRFYCVRQNGILHKWIQKDSVTNTDLVFRNKTEVLKRTRTES